jgi:hypothetical protein
MLVSVCHFRFVSDRSNHWVGVMDGYWFAEWLQRNRVRHEASLRKVFARRQGLASLLEAAPPPIVHVSTEPPQLVELTGGKGIDLTGKLGCRHIDCIEKELDELFHHAWHYFDRILLPDQALYRVVDFNQHKDTDALVAGLSSFIKVLQLLEKVGGDKLVVFEARTPGCTEHFHQHAQDAGIDQALANTNDFLKELITTGKMSWNLREEKGHMHLGYRLVHQAFVHYEWGSLCSLQAPLPEEREAIRRAVAESVLRKYTAELCADALSARRRRTPLGATIPCYRRLLATHPSVQVEDVAFELHLPIAKEIPVSSLIKLRKDEADAFERFQVALRTAVKDRLATASSSNAKDLAREIKRDVIDPELRKIREKLKASRSLTVKSAGTGMALGVAAATVGLLTPLHANPIGTGLVVGGAITLGASSLKKAVDDYLAVKREVSLSDMYFLWQAHRH